MELPELVRDRIGDETVRETVELSGEDLLVVTTTRAVVYYAEGLLSSESVTEYDLDADRVTITESRRKSTLRFEYGVAGAEEITVPNDALDEALKPLMGGVLTAADITDRDEQVKAVYRLGELTVIITEGHLVKHIGDAVWDTDVEIFPFAEVTELDLEEGEVSSQIIVTAGGRPERIKIPTTDALRIQQEIESALLAYHGADSYAEFTEQVESTAEAADEAPAEPVETEENDDDEEAEHQEPVSMSLIETKSDSQSQTDDIAAELADIRDVVARQNELLEAQQQTIEQLIEELRRQR